MKQRAQKSPLVEAATLLLRAKKSGAHPKVIESLDRRLSDLAADFMADMKKVRHSFPAYDVIVSGQKFDI